MQQSPSLNSPVASVIERQTGAAIRAQSSALADAIVALHYARQPELWERYGDVGRTKSIRDAVYTLTYLAQAMVMEHPALFMEYVAWCKVLFANLRLPEHALETTLHYTREVVTAQLPIEQARVAADYLNLALEALPTAPSAPPSFIRPDAPHATLAQTYLDTLLTGDRRHATRLIEEAVTNNVTVRDLYRHVFTVVQHEIGRLWQMNQISVAQEHYVSAATQLLMSMLYPRMFTATAHDRTVVVASIGGELHEIGARMVADTFEMEGWDSHYLGANTPLESIAQTVVARQADIAAISVTLTINAELVETLISRLRNHAPATKILVGGYTFNLAPDLWRTVGADGWAPDADAAVTVAENLVR